MKILIKNGRLVDPASGLDQVGDLAIQDLGHQVVRLLAGKRPGAFLADSAFYVAALMAAFAMYSLARRFVPERAMLATLLFLAVPAFVVNGNSFESDLVFLAFWLISISYYIRAVDTQSVYLLSVSALAGALAALDAFQAGMLTPILGLYLWQHNRKWTAGWIAIFAAPATIVLWQAWEWSTGALPLAVLLGYMQSASLQSSPRKLASAVALIGHAGWIVFPALVAAAFWKTARWWCWSIAGIAAAAAFLHDPNPLFWGSVAMGTLLVLSCLRKEFLSGWVVLFFAASLVIFFAGSARYLLPISAPVAILVAREVPSRGLMAGIAIQLLISLGLATANHQHWEQVRTFADRVVAQLEGLLATPAERDTITTAVRVASEADRARVEAAVRDIVQPANRRLLDAIKGPYLAADDRRPVLDGLLEHALHDEARTRERSLLGDVADVGRRFDADHPSRVEFLGEEPLGVLGTELGPAARTVTHRRQT